jgi:predicted transcriptional regulator
MCVANGSNRYATYTVTPKGQELIEKVKQYKKENKK